MGTQREESKIEILLLQQEVVGEKIDYPVEKDVHYSRNTIEKNLFGDYFAEEWVEKYDDSSQKIPVLLK